MKIWTTIFPLAIFAVGCTQPAKSPAEVKQDNRDSADEKLAAATAVLDNINEIPVDQRERAQCVAVIPSAVRAGFIVGGGHGDGVVSCRDKSGWSAPAFIAVTSGSAGFQIGVESSDVVMLVMSKRGVERLSSAKFSLGADASVAAGLVGEGKHAGTTPNLNADVISYSHSKGLFAGADLGGSVVKQDTDALTALYGPSANVSAILGGKVAPPPQAEAFLARLEAAFPQAPAERSEQSPATK